MSTWGDAWKRTVCVVPLCGYTTTKEYPFCRVCWRKVTDKQKTQLSNISTKYGNESEKYTEKLYEIAWNIAAHKRLRYIRER